MTRLSTTASDLNDQIGAARKKLSICAILPSESYRVVNRTSRMQTEVHD